MLVRRSLAVLSFAGVASWSGLAGAQYFRADPTVRVTAGYNLNEVVYDDPALQPLIQSGPLVTIAPALALIYDTPLVTQKLTLTSTLGLPLTKSFTFYDQPPTYSLKANYTGSVQLDALTLLTLLGGATATPLNGFSTLEDPTLTPIDAPPDAGAYNFSLTGTATIRHDLSPDSYLTQTTHALYNLPFNVDPIRASTLTVKTSLGVTRKWTLDTLSLTGSVAVNHFGPAETGNGVTDARSQVLNNLLVTWRRTITEDLTGSLNLGVSQTLSPGTTAGQVWLPTGGATLIYSLAPASVTLQYSYTTLADIYTAQTNVTNQVSLRATLPISTSGLALAGTAGFISALPLGDFGVGRDSFTSDVGLTYAPLAVPKLSVSLRGVYVRQVPLDDPLQATTRYGLIFNVAFSYPNTTSVDVMARITPSFVPSANLQGDVTLGPEIVPELQAPSDPVGPSEPAPPPPAAP